MALGGFCLIGRFGSRGVTMFLYTIAHNWVTFDLRDMRSSKMKH
jgi:hypothetical protein